MDESVGYGGPIDRVCQTIWSKRSNRTASPVYASEGVAEDARHEKMIVGSIDNPAVPGAAPYVLRVAAVVSLVALASRPRTLLDDRSGECFWPESQCPL